MPKLAPIILEGLSSDYPAGEVVEAHEHDAHQIVHALAGVELPLSPQFNVLFEARRSWADDDLKGSDLAKHTVGSFSSSIAGGTDEIQRNIIGDRVLGLPRDIAVDRGVPFKELKVGTQTD